VSSWVIWICMVAAGGCQFEQRVATASRKDCHAQLRAMRVLPAAGSLTVGSATVVEGQGLLIALCREERQPAPPKPAASAVGKRT
jgi:hypothetical protein